MPAARSFCASVDRAPYNVANELIPAQYSSDCNGESHKEEVHKEEVKVHVLPRF